MQFGSYNVSVFVLAAIREKLQRDGLTRHVTSIEDTPEGIHVNIAYGGNLETVTIRIEGHHLPPLTVAEQAHEDAYASNVNDETGAIIHAIDGLTAVVSAHLGSLIEVSKAHAVHQGVSLDAFDDDLPF